MVVLAAMPLVRTILGWVDASPEVERLARQYIDVRLYGGLTVTVLWACDNFYRGLGRTTMMMWCGIAQLVLNCGFNWMFIFGKLGAPAMGAAGAALGTVLAQLVDRALSARQHPGVRSDASPVRHPPALALPAVTLRRMGRLSVPIGIQTGLEMGGVTVFTAVVARIGDAELAATNAVIQAWSVAFMGAVALAVGATTLVGQCIGAGEPEQAPRGGAAGVTWLGYGLTAAFGVFYVLAPQQLMGLFVSRRRICRGCCRSPVRCSRSWWCAWCSTSSSTCSPARCAAPATPPTAWW